VAFVALSFDATLRIGFQINDAYRRPINANDSRFLTVSPIDRNTLFVNFSATNFSVSGTVFEWSEGALQVSLFT
jgi:hypothetical protein